MLAADEYEECALLSAKLAKIVPKDRERWLGMAERWAALVVRAREARPPRYPRRDTAPVVASSPPIEDPMLDEDIFDPIEHKLERFHIADSNHNVPMASVHFLSTLSATADAPPQGEGARGGSAVSAR